MPDSVIELTSEDRAEYDDLVSVSGPRFAFHSWAFRDFLEQLLPAGQARYLGLIDADELVAVLPAFVDRAELGSVVSSLPFHASNGGVLTRPGVDWNEAAVKLLDALRQVAAEEDALSLTVVSDPRRKDHGINRATLRPQYEEHRTGQWTDLQTPGGSEGLWTRIHSKTRNAVRKAEKSGVVIGPASGERQITEFLDLHRSNMQRLGGLPKTSAVVSALRTSMRPPAACELLVAEHENSMAAGVLTITAGGVVEYLVPAYDESRRDLQALTALVWTGLKRAADSDATVWNWGGTRGDQDGVFRFKNRWAANDAEYAIQTLVIDPHVLDFPRSEVSRQFPYSWVVPFSALGDAVPERLG